MELWKEHYKLGVDQLDQQHRQMILTLEDLLKALKEPGADYVRQAKHTIDFAKNYVVVHFHAEEMYMEQQHYPGLERHRTLHKKMVDDMRTLEHRLMREDYSRPSVKALGNLLTRWWMYHIMTEDKKIVGQGANVPQKAE